MGGDLFHDCALARGRGALRKKRAAEKKTTKSKSKVAEKKATKRRTKK
jgi:hypothetical protein